MREFENEWYIKQIIAYQNEVLRGYADYEWIEKQNLLTVCARAIELTCEDIGFVMPLDMFFEWTTNGSLTDYDGHGYFLDKEGKRLELVNFFTTRYPEDAVYVAWYNK